MNSILRLCACGAVLSLAALAAAVSMAGESGPYAGFALGATHGTINRGDLGPLNFGASFDEDRSDRQLSVFGGYRFDRMWSVEGGYSDGGRYRETVTASSGSLYLNTAYQFDYKARSLFVAGKASFGLADKLSGFARLGISVNRATMTRSVDASRHIEPPVAACPPSEPNCLTPFSNSSLFAGADHRGDTRLAPLLGLGLEYQVTETGVLRLALDDFGRFGDASKTGRFKLRTLGLAYVQSF